MDDKDLLIKLLDRFIRQRSGLDFRNYGDVSAYRAEARSITKRGAQAKELLRVVNASGVTAEGILQAAKSAYSGRLTIVPDPKGKGGYSVDYCVGQYFPTEYRRAVCAVLSAALWGYWREQGAPTGDAIRAAARRNLSRSVVREWFR